MTFSPSRAEADHALPSGDRQRKRTHVWAEEAGQHLVIQRVCEEVVQPHSQSVFLPAKWHREYLLLIPFSGREVGVVCKGEEQNDEKVSGTPRSVL